MKTLVTPIAMLTALIPFSFLPAGEATVIPLAAMLSGAASSNNGTITLPTAGRTFVIKFNVVAVESFSNSVSGADLDDVNAITVTMDPSQASNLLAAAACDHSSTNESMEATKFAATFSMLTSAGN